MGRLDGRRIIVTGAGSGIGHAVAERLAAEGAHIVAGDIDLDGATRLAAAVGGEAHRLDVTDPGSWDAIVAAAGPLDALVNCAGVDGAHDTIEGCTAAEWDRVMRVNLDGTFLGTKAAVAAMLGAGAGGSIVNISSVLAIVADGETVSYASSKAAVRGLTRSVALAVAADGIRCNTIHPGYIRTPMTDRWLTALDTPDAESALVAAHPIGRLGTPDEVAALALYLVSDDAAFVTGAELAVDGGYLAV